jgi:hypothetical protein
MGIKKYVLYIVLGHWSKAILLGIAFARYIGRQSYAFLRIFLRNFVIYYAKAALVQVKVVGVWVWKFFYTTAHTKSKTPT